MQCEHDGTITVTPDGGGIRCNDCGRLICNEHVRGDYRSPNGLSTFGFRPCNRTATLRAVWPSKTLGQPMTTYVCQRHARRVKFWNVEPFDNVPQLGKGDNR